MNSLTVLLLLISSIVVAVVVYLFFYPHSAANPFPPPRDRLLIFPALVLGGSPEGALAESGLGRLMASRTPASGSMDPSAPQIASTSEDLDVADSSNGSKAQTSSDLVSTASFVPTLTPTAVLPFTTTPTPWANPEGRVDPFVGAPLCSDHDGTKFHGLWNEALGCHYDHEHGKDPHNSPLFSTLTQISGGQEISYLWATPNENLLKHGGYKYDWRAGITCEGREGSPYGVSDYVILRHGVGDYARAMSTPFHSFSGAVVICSVATGKDIGMMATGGWQSFGQRTSPYQGEILPFDYGSEYAAQGGYNPYNPAREPYIAIDCVFSDCGRDLGNVTGNSTWISEPGNLFGNELFAFLFRVRDAHSVVDGPTRFGPFLGLRFLFICSDDGGLTFQPEGCRKNNSTGAVHEIVGTIPDEWDILDGVLDGHVTYEGFTDRWGRLVDGCSTVGIDCVPLILENVPIGRYGMQDSGDDGNPFDEQSIPDYDICFKTDGAVIACEDGGTPSGWISDDN